MRSLVSLAVFMSAQSAVWHWLHRLGGPGLVLLGVLDSSVIPLPGSMDVFTIVLSAHNRPWWPYYGFFATLGAVIGGYLTYRLAEKGGEETLEKKIGKSRAEKVYKKFEKQGSFWVFIGSILPPPFPIVPFLMAAGVLQFPKKKFLAALAAGRGARFFADAYVAHVYGKVIIKWLDHYRQPLLYTAIALGVAAGLGALVFFKWYLPRKKKQDAAKKHEHPAPAGHKVA
jgi:membrane protein YqaA with SNARE-associated domain